MTGVERVRDGETGGMREDALHSHWAPMTWPVCVTEGCAVRVDPWDHNTRCSRHRPADPDQVDVNAALATIPRFTCPRCERTSYNPTDIREGYCGACHIFTKLRAELSA